MNPINIGDVVDGWTVNNIIKSDSYHVNLYMTHQCGHQRKIDVGSFRKRKPQCRKCKTAPPEVGTKYGDWTFEQVGRWPGGERFFEFSHSCGARVKHRSLRLVDKKKCKKCEARIAYRSQTEQVVLNDMYRKYKGAAKKRKYDFLLTRSEFANLVVSKCYYCHREPFLDRKIQPARRKKWHGDARMKLNGVDRMDNTKGYTIENSVPCCSTCNTAKLCMTLTEWREMVGLWAKAAGL